MKIRIGKNVESVKEEARAELIDHLSNNRGRAVLLLCSGGSALELLDRIPANCFGSHMTLCVLDERYSTDEAANNFSQLQKTPLFVSAQTMGARSIDTRLKTDETLEELAYRFEQSLRQWQEEHPKGVMIATMGIGPDGHTSGVMPFPEDEQKFLELFDDSTIWVRGYDAGKKNQYPLRVTTTLPFLRLIDHAIVYCIGEGKRDALKQIMADDGTLAETPARILREMKDVTIFTDITP